MSLSQFIILSIALLIIVGMFIYHFVFNIYEVVFLAKNSIKSASDFSIIAISSIPVNSFGWKIPFRKSKTSFKIEDGENLVTILSNDLFKGKIILKVKNITGKVIISAKSNYAIFPSSFTFNIVSGKIKNDFI